MEATNTDFERDQLSIGFWHPFGPHGDESSEDILPRKARETLANAWTLWSFKFYSEPSLRLWSTLIADSGTPLVYAFCSDSKPQHSVQPGGVMALAKEYKAVNDPDWKPVPHKIKVTFHPTGDGTATAFVVKQVILLSTGKRRPPFLVKRYSLGQKQWRSDLGGKHEGQLRLPTRNESLIRIGGKTILAPVQAVLELAPPFVVAIR